MKPLKRILLIETDPYDRHLLLYAFRGRYQLLFSDNIDEGIGISMRFEPNVVLLSLSHIDLETIGRVHILRAACGGTVPVIVAVAENSLELERQARQQGIFYYLTKPFDFEELDEVLESAAALADEARARAV